MTRYIRAWITVTGIAGTGEPEFKVRLRQQKIADWEYIPEGAENSIIAVKLQGGDWTIMPFARFKALYPEPEDMKRVETRAFRSAEPCPKETSETRK